MTVEPSACHSPLGPSTGQTSTTRCAEFTNIIKGGAALNLAASAVRRPSDGDKYRFDGSYVAATTGNWVIGLGAIDRWWGPGWQSSLILSNNARPAPGVFIKRKSAEKASSPLLSWAGPWQVELFANQLDDERVINNPLLTGARLTIKPLSFFELSQSYLNIHGGDDGTTESSGEAAETTEETQRHISYDARLHGSVKHLTWALYGQRLRNEKQTETAAQTGSLMGAEVSFSLKNTHNRIVVEVSDTTHDLSRIEEASLSALYEHPFYAEGYRYHGRALGEAADTNAKKISLTGSHYFANGQNLNWRVSDIDFNENGPSRNPFGETALSQKFYELSYAVPLNEVAQISGGVFYLNEDMQWRSQDISSGGFAMLELRF